MDRDVVARKLEQLRHHVARIDSKKPLDAARLVVDERGVYRETAPNVVKA